MATIKQEQQTRASRSHPRNLSEASITSHNANSPEWISKRKTELRATYLQQQLVKYKEATAAGVTTLKQQHERTLEDIKRQHENDIQLMGDRFKAHTERILKKNKEVQGETGKLLRQKNARIRALEVENAGLRLDTEAHEHPCSKSIGHHPVSSSTIPASQDTGSNLPAASAGHIPSSIVANVVMARHDDDDDAQSDKTMNANGLLNGSVASPNDKSIDKITADASRVQAFHLQSQVIVDQALEIHNLRNQLLTLEQVLRGEQQRSSHLDIASRALSRSQVYMRFGR
jgi:hypothetical protein